jgi:signal-transduction protein with cAMP-binding, CBS, and nucleotidyltransferase domain
MEGLVMSKISDYMSAPVLTTDPDILASDSIDKMFENKVGVLLVEKNGEYVGIFSRIDWMHLVLRGECDPKVVKVSSIMSSHIITVDKNETLAKASILIEENNIRHIAVTEDGKIIGMLSVRDLEKYYHHLHEKEVYC